MTKHIDVNAGLSAIGRQAVENLLSAHFGTRIHITDVQAFAYSPVSRCTLEASDSATPRSVIVRVPRNGTWRSGLAPLHNEQAALTFLTSIGSTMAPRFIASDATAGLLVTEDLGTGPSLLDLLLGDNEADAHQGLLAFARGLGTLHAQTARSASAYDEGRAGLGPADPDTIYFHVAESWRRVYDAVAELRLPHPQGVDRDIDEIVRTFAVSDDYLALSSGDPSPVNCKIGNGTVRFFDFEEGTFRHALIDATVLRYLYPTGGPPWRLPKDMANLSERVYQEEIAGVCPSALNDAAYQRGMAAASAAWTIQRLVRLPKVEAGPDRDSWPLLPLGWSGPIPMRSRRQQLVAIMGTFIASARRAGSLETLATWCDRTVGVLRERWPEATEESPLYPAFTYSRKGTTQQTAPCG